METLETLRVLEDELGAILKSGMSGESLYYSAHWEEIREHASRIAREQHLEEPNDVRVANYALELIGIPHARVEADQDEKGTWIVYWR
jgi:hypothetical protein